MVWRWMLDNCHATLGEHLLCLENEQSHATLNFQEYFHKAGEKIREVKTHCVRLIHFAFRTYLSTMFQTEDMYVLLCVVSVVKDLPNSFACLSLGLE